MKLANAIFAIGIGAYFTLGVYTSILWSDLYYSIVFGYICSLISNSKMIMKWDRAFAYSIAGTIWMLYMIKQLIDLNTFNWIRYFTGIIFVVIAVVYYFKSKGK